jgi:hypothetical protein
MSLLISARQIILAGMTLQALPVAASGRKRQLSFSTEQS